MKKSLFFKALGRSYGALTKGAADRGLPATARAPAPRRFRRTVGLALVCLAACGGDDDSGGGGGGGGGIGGSSGSGGGIGIPNDAGCVENGLPCLGCPTGEFCWDHPAPYGAALQTLSADGDSNVWAGGSDETLLHFDGAEWRLWRMPAKQPVKQVSVAAGVTWVATTGGLYRYDGLGWTEVEPPDEFSGTPQVIAAVPGGKVWAADDGRVALFDGDAWSVTSSGIRLVTALWAASADEAFAVGGGLEAGHYSGGAWAVEKLDGSAPLAAIGGSSPTDVWVADSEERTGPTGVRHFFHWDGAAWTAHDGPTSSTPTAIAVTKDNGLWIASGQSEIYHGDGVTFAATAPLGRPFTPYGFGDNVFALALTSPTTGWAVGGGGHIVRFDASVGWSSVNAPPDENLGAPVAVGPGNVWVPGTRFFHHFTGASWVQEKPYPDAMFARRIFVESPTSLWAAFSNRGVWHYDGSAWSLFNGEEAIDDAAEVWANGPDVWAVLEDRSLLRLSGEAWAPVDPGIDAQHLWGIGGGPYVVGLDASEASAVRRFDGAAFQPVDFGGGAIGGSFGHADGSLWLVVERGGAHSLVKLSSGPAAEQSGPPDLDAISSLWVGSSDDIWVTGVGAATPRAYHWDGQAWASHATPQAGPIASDGTDVFIGANAGVLRLKRAD